MFLTLLHGREHPAERLDTWGFDGPTLHGVSWLAVTYLSTFRVGFDDAAAATIAHRITGWDWIDELTLEIGVSGELIHTPGLPTPSGTTGAWFGDWSLDDDIDTFIGGLPQRLTRLPVGERIAVLRRLGAALRDHVPEAADALEFPPIGGRHYR
jgi:hypothetical protein